MSTTNVARMEERANNWETCSRQQCCCHNVSSFCRPLVQRLEFVRVYLFFSFSLVSAMRSVRSLVRPFVRSFKVSFILLPGCKYKKYGGSRVSWEAAKRNCESHGLTLAHFSTKQDAIDAADTSCVVGTQGDSKFWVGLKRNSMSGLFSWSDDETTQFPFSEICPGDLFNAQSCDVAEEQLCYHMVQMQDGKHYLQREKCSRTQHYICQGERTKV